MASVESVWLSKVAGCRQRAICVASLVLLFCGTVWPQAAIMGTTTPSPTQSLAPKDSLGRTTPRGTVLGFLAAAQKGEYDIATEYLNTHLRGKAATRLAQELSVVLDRRLPPRLNQLSDKPEGSQLDPLNSNRDLVGIITSSNGNVEIHLERVERGKAGWIWLFSSKTLESIPDLYEEIDVVPVDEVLPDFLVSTRVFGVPLFGLVALFVGLPLLYLVTLLLNRLLGTIVGRLRRRLSKRADLPNPDIVPGPIRLLLIALTIHWLVSKTGLSLLARQFWSSVALILAIAGVVWILILANSRAEEYVDRRLRRRNLVGVASVVRLTRRFIDLLFIFAAALLVLYFFGVNLTAALAGLGVGGIAVALAAQKTLENVIGGVSLIFDQVVRVGDTLKLGDTLGTVDEIGLRSTRIRTLDRTLVSVPNGQIATMSLEALSARDKFWFHPLIGLRYETTAAQIRSVVDNIRLLLAKHSSVEHASVRVRFMAFASSSLDVDVFAYFYARDWNHFMEIQEEVLLAIMEIIQRNGTQLALPSRAMYLADTFVPDGTTLPGMLKPGRSTAAAK